MNNNRDVDGILDRALSEIASEQLAPEAQQQIADRAWTQVEPELSALADSEETASRRIRDCSDFQALIPAYLRDSLSEAKALLVEDHLGECVPCRRQLKQARAARRGAPPVSPSARERNWAATLGLRVAAAAVIFIALVGLSIKTDIFSIQAGGLIRIERLDGEAFRVSDKGSVPVRVGDEISFEDARSIRTGKGSNASFRLVGDDSLIEMNERSELAVRNVRPFWTRGDGDSRIDLTRGSIIVEASEQGTDHLHVDTQDCSVAVTGTVFAVNHGIRGSRVSVIEGEVELAVGGSEKRLRPGQQATSNPGLGRVPVVDDIAWSKNLDRHLVLLGELTRVTREIEAQLDGPGVRYSTELLDLAPEGTAIYIGIPNVSATLSDAYDLLQEKIAANDVLQQWWDSNVTNSNAEIELAEAMEKIRSYGEHLDEELAITMPVRDGEVSEPLILAKLTRPDAFREFVRAELTNLGIQDLELLEGEFPNARAPQSGGRQYLWIRDDYLAISGEIELIQAFDANLREGRRTGFVGGEFHGHLAQLYSDGVEWVVGVDVRSMIDADGDADPDLERLGFSDLDHVMAVRKTVGERTESRATLTFDEPRKGLASWLAEPAPMGSLDFISPDATFAAGFVMREPVAMLDELFQFISSGDVEFEQELERFQSEHGIDIRADFAVALGGEFAVGIDGPLLPNPSWKFVLEVYDPVKLQGSLEWAVERLNEVAAEAGRQGFRIEREDLGGRTYHRMLSLDTGISANYLYVDGYFVAGASRALLDRALKFRDSGLTLVSSPRFVALLPQDSELNFSAVVYENLASVLGSLSGHLAGASSLLTPEQQRHLKELKDSGRPSLTLAYGEENRIAFVNSAEGGLFSSSVGSLLRLDTLLSVQELLGRMAREEVRDEPAGDDRRERHDWDTNRG